MKITDILPEAHVVHRLKASSKKLVLQEIASFAAEKIQLDGRDVFNCLLEREKIGSTGVGNGVAIPHAKIKGLTALAGCFFLLSQKIDFDAVDDLPVNLIFLLLTPESEKVNHLQALAHISRLMRDKSLCKNIAHAASSQQIYEFLSAPQSIAA